MGKKKRVRNPRQDLEALIAHYSGKVYNYETAPKRYKEDFDELVELFENVCINIGYDEYDVELYG